ncbi:MAG TPA: hypothetical protein GX700_04130 [Paracoccus sp.]|nr:hypothetical protein [Paracoccus sp. (in: a-proteobacteria)]
MSDALTNSEIEDVLTSVRRLVADEQHRAEGEDGRDGRLILTPSQRVDAGASPAPAPAEPSPTPSPTPAVRASAMANPPDFRRLEATIAELEAAVSASGSVFEPDGSETMSEEQQGSNVTALYAKPSFQHFATSPPLEAAQADPADDAPVTTAWVDEMAEDDDTFETVIDEATLRILVAQIVREELHGQLGERITLQVRKLVRAEIARTLDARGLL